MVSSFSFFSLQRNNIIRLEVGKLRLKAKKSATSAKKETKKVAKPAPKKK
jgi:hypothetical protein